MRFTSQMMRSTAIAALLSLPLAGGAAVAQDSQTGAQQLETVQPETDELNRTELPKEQTDLSGQTADQTQDTAEGGAATDTTQDTAEGTAPGADPQDGTPPADAVVATVGDAEIRGSDVTTFIGMLPPQMQSQPPRLLLPMAVQQLILRELILEEARTQNLADDPEVKALAETANRAAEDDAMVQVWLIREMEGAVTDDAVQKVYDQASQQSQQKLPPLEQVRPQIEQSLRQQAMQEIQQELREGADIVLYDPSGQPIEPPQPDGAQQSQSTPGSDGPKIIENDTTTRSSDAGTSGNTTSGTSTTIEGSGESETGALSGGDDLETLTDDTEEPTQ